MLTHGSILVSLLWLVEQIPTPAPLGQTPARAAEFYSDKLFVKALIVMIIRRLYTAYALLNFLEQADPVAQQVRLLLTEHGRFPTRRTWDRRFATLPARLPALIGCLGRHLVTLLQALGRPGTCGRRRQYAPARQRRRLASGTVAIEDLAERRPGWRSGWRGRGRS